MASVFDGIKPVVEERLSPAKTPFFTSVDCSQRDVLIEGEFIELNDQLWIDKHVRILVTSEFLYLTEEGSENQIKNQSHVLQPDPTKTVLKFDRSDIELELIEGCQYTFRAKWNHDESWKRYRLCGLVSDQKWLKWIRCFQLCSSSFHPPVPMAIPETLNNTDVSSSDDEDDDAEAEEVSLPKCLPLCVDRAMSMLSMTMLNPSNVRKLAFSNLQDIKYQKNASLGTIGSESEDVFESVVAGTLFPSTSYPRLSFTKPFCTFSLMNVCDLENVNIDDDLKSKRGVSELLDQGYVQQIKSKSLNKQRKAKFQNITATEITLQNRIDHLRAHPSNLNFVRRHLWDEKTLSVPSAVHNRRLSLSLALTCDSNRIPQSTEHLQLGGMNPAKRALKRTESSPARQLYSVKQTATPIIKTPVARRLNFKDDMAIDVASPDQKPQKAKVRKFLTILQKKRTRNHPPLPEIPFSPSKDLNNANVNTSPSKLRRIKSFSGGSTGRSRRQDELSPSKDTKREKGVVNSTTLQTSSQDPVTESPLSRKGSSSSTGSVRKKLVQKIFSPILKSSSLEEGEVGRSLSPTETPFPPEFGDVFLTGGHRGLVAIDSITFAKEITLIDKELFVRILWHELESCGWMTKDKYVRSPNVMEIVEFFNRVALLVATEILAEETPQARARVISKVIQIADKCRLLGNFNSLKALMAGLQSTPLYRMKETWKEVSSKRRKKFRDLSMLMGESDNFALYRKEVANCLANGPCLPFFGDFLTQIAQSQAFMSVKRKRQKTAKEIQPDTVIDGSPVNGVTKCNGLTPLSHNEVNSCPTTPREFSPDTSCDLIDEKRETTVTCSLHDVFSRDRAKRGSSRIKLKRFHSRQNSTEIETPFNHNRNHSAELLDVHRFKSRLMPASSDSVISNSNSSNGHYGNSPRTPSSGRPPLLRRMSESASSSFFSGSFAGKPKRRLSESSKSSKPRRFLDGLVRRSTSSNSVKDSRVHRGVANDVLGHSFSTQSIREGSVNSHEVLGKSVSTPLIKDGCNLLSQDISRDFSRDCSCEQLESSSTFDEERWQSLVRSSERSNIAGTELQLIKYQMAAVQYDFVSNPEVRQFLLNASFNTEEENYRLSIKREPPVKAT